MFGNSIQGGVENGVKYLELIIDLIRKIFESLFGGSSTTTTTTTTTTTEAE